MRRKKKRRIEKWQWKNLSVNIRKIQNRDKMKCNEYSGHYLRHNKKRKRYR